MASIYNYISIGLKKIAKISHNEVFLDVV